MQLTCIMAQKELDTLLQQSLGTDIRGAKTKPFTRDAVDRIPAFRSKQRELALSLKTHGFAMLALNPEGIRFTQALGPYGLIRLALPEQASSPRQVFATITPDTEYSADRLRFAYLGRWDDTGKKLWIPEHVDPASVPNKLSPNDVSLYLSAANQLATVGDHEHGTPIPIVEPRHLLNAIADFAQGSTVHSLLSQIAPGKRSHAGDMWEEQNRSFLPILSPKTPQDLAQRVDPVWVPISVTRTYSLHDQLPMAIVFTPDLVDQNQLYNDKIVPISANIPGALEHLQRMGFATLLQNGMAAHMERRLGENPTV